MHPPLELAKLCRSGNAMVSSFAGFFCYFGDMVNSLVALIGHFLANTSWDPNDDESIIRTNANFYQSFDTETSDAPIAPWIRAIPYRRYEHGAYWAPGSQGSEVTSLKPGLESPLKPGVKATQVTRSDLERVGFVNPQGAPWIKTQHGVTSLEELFELLFVRLPCGSSHRRMSGNMNERRLEGMKSIMRVLYTETRTRIPDHVGNGFAIDAKFLYVEDYGCIELVLCFAYITLVWKRSAHLLRVLPPNFQPVEEWKYWECCTGFETSLNPLTTNVSDSAIVAAVIPWLKDEPKFYVPGWYNNRSIGFVVASDGVFDLVIAKNIYSPGMIGLIASKHESPATPIPISAFPAASKKREWGEHFTAWLGIFDRNEKLEYFKGVDINAFYVPPGISAKEIADHQNDTFQWTGPEDDGLVANGCPRYGHHISPKQLDPCRVCRFLDKYGLPGSYEQMEKYFPYIPDSAVAAMARLLDPIGLNSKVAPPDRYLATYYRNTLNWLLNTRWKIEIPLPSLESLIHDRRKSIKYTNGGGIEFT